ncbi:MAG: 50S ribosomal protein L25 [Patescibacteria group bacterium]
MNAITAKTRQPGEKSVTDKDTAMLKAEVYGKGLPNQSIFLHPSDFLKLYREVKYSSLFDLMVDDKEPVKALIQDVQVNPVSMQPIHVDIRQIRMDQPITVTVPLAFVGESDAVKMGGTLIKSIDEVEVECLPANLPKELNVDLGILKTYDDQITFASLQIPEGVKVNRDPEEVIAFAEEPLSEEELKKLEESQVGDVSAVKSEADEKAESAAAEGAEGEAKSEESK